MSLGDSRSSTGTACPPKVASPSLSLRTRLSTNILTASASSTSSGPPSHRGPLSSAPLPLLGSWSPSAVISGPGMTGGVGNATTSSSKLSLGGCFQGGSLQAGSSPCHLSQSRPLMFRQPCQGPGGIGRPAVVGQGPPLVPQPFPNMPCQPFLPLPEGKSRVCSSSPSQNSHPSTNSQLVCPPVEFRGVEHRVWSPTMLVQPSPATGSGSERSGTSPSLSSNHVRPLHSPLLPSPCLSRGERGQQRSSQGEDMFPSLSQKGRPIQRRSGHARVGNVPASVNSCLVRSPHVGFSKLESEQTLSEKSRPAINDYNKDHLSRPGSVYSLKVSF